MRLFGWTRGSDVTGEGGTVNARQREDDPARERAEYLRALVDSVTPEEFSWQEAHYEQDSLQGRELLFLMANHEWVRATAEIIDIPRSDEIQARIKIGIDLGQITHEAFRDRRGPVWLPVSVLPPQPEQDRFEPDLFATVTDAAGNPVPMLPAVDLRHQMSAAMAEIIAKMAISHWPDPAGPESLVATREEYFLLSAAIYRMLRHDPKPTTGSTASKRADEPQRVRRARGRLLYLLDKYIDLLPDPDVTAKKEAPKESQFAPELVRRAVKVLEALTESVIVVVRMNFNRDDLAPSVLTVHVPNRRLDMVRKPRPRDPRIWRWAITPYGRLKIDMLLPTADADRQIQINLPEGISIDEPADKSTGQDGGEPTGKASRRKPSRPPSPRLDISVHEPPLLQDLSRSMEQIFPPADGKPPDVVKLPATLVPRFIVLVWQKSAQFLDMLRTKMKRNDTKDSPAPDAGDSDNIRSSVLERPFIDLARKKSAQALDMLRYYKVKAIDDQEDNDLEDVGPSDAGDDRSYPELQKLAEELGKAVDAPDDPITELKTAWQSYTEHRRYLFRRILTVGHKTLTVVARAGMIENVSQRATPKRAAIYVDLKVDDRDYFSTARSSAFMSLILMLGVLTFLVFWRFKPGSNAAIEGPAPEVLAIVLTLFVTIQAERIERPDRSTLRGQLFAMRNWLIAASVLPAITLALALAFRAEGSTAQYWAAGCILVQLAFLGLLWRRPERPDARTRIRNYRTFSTDPPDYHHFEALRSDYWRNTTGQALMIGRKAYGYVVWQKADPDQPGSPDLGPLLSWQDESKKNQESSNVLALLRSGTLDQAITFMVFRDKPATDWASSADNIKELDLHPDRLAPTDSVNSKVDVFVGFGRDEMLKIREHPLVSILETAKNKLIVLDVQLPVPSPVAKHGDKQWARIRVALRDADDIGRLSSFLSAVHSEMTGKQHAGHVVVVKAVRGGRRHVITGPAAGTVQVGDGNDEPVYTGDLDIVHDPATLSEKADDLTWRVLTICADARSNIESDIITQLAAVRERFDLTGFTYALLHGTAVMVLLVHDRQMAQQSGGTADLESELRGKPGLTKVQVLLDKQLSWAELGHATGYPMLRAGFRWQDRPRAFLNVLNSIKEGLSTELTSLQPNDWSISYAQAQVETGQVATGHLTIRMHLPAEKVNWSEDTMKEMGVAAAEEARKAALDSPDGLGPPENPLISIDRMMKPRSG